MADFSALKTTIQNNIKQNGNEEITGSILQQILLAIVDTLGDSAINGLITDLSNEVTARQNADSLLQQGINSEASTRGNADTQLQNNINSEANARSTADGQLQTAINAIHTQIDNGYVYAGIATPSTSPATGKVFYIAVQAGTYTNFGSTIVTEGITILRYVGSAWVKEQIIYADGGVFDVTAQNGGATFASLEALMSDDNLSTLIPAAVRKGGMSIKFVQSSVQSSDNKYLQYRLMSDTFNTTVANWQGVDDEVKVLSNNIPTSNTVYNAVEKVEEVLDDKQTIIGANASWAEGACHLTRMVEYRITNIGTNAIAPLTFKNGSTNVLTINSLAANSSTVITPMSADVDNYRAYCDGAKASFIIVRVEDKILSSAKETLLGAKEFTISKLEKVNSFLIQGGGWVEKQTALLPKYSYTIEKLSGAGTVAQIAATKDGSAVTVSGFSSLTNIGDKCTIKVASEADTLKLRFIDGYCVVSITSDKVDIMEKELDAGIKDLASLKSDVNKRIGGVTATGSGWYPWTACMFYKDRSYKIKNISANANSSIISAGFVNANGGSVTYTGGSLPITAGNSITIKFSQDVVQFRLYFDGGQGTATIEYDENIVDEVEQNTRNVEIPESYSSKDSNKHQLVVAKDGLDGHYATIAAAFAAITDSSYTNQYEVIVYPGKYNELNLIVPAFTHVHGAAPGSVVVSSEGVNPTSTLPVFEQQKSCTKISNMTIESHNGYCIHFDEQLSDRCIVNENLVLYKAARPAGATTWACVGGGTFYDGTKYVWKNCVFKSINPLGYASCHTNGNQLNGNTHLIFDGCSFINCGPRIGSVGAFGHYVCEITNCNFPIGNEGLSNWYSPIRNIDNPSLYRFDKNEWQIIGGGNKNLSMWQLQNGKTVRIRADYPITISGSAANIIFGYNPTYNNIKTARLDCMVTSEYYIADEQAGYSGYSELRDVFQLWKRLGDCSVENKTLSVTVNGVTKTYTFTEDYLTSKTSQATIIAAMQAVLDNVTIEAYIASGYGYFNINTTDVIMQKVTAQDILKGEFVTASGGKATSSTNSSDIIGIACEDKPHGEYVKVWTSAFRFDTDYADGEYGLDANGALDANAANKIGFINGYNFYLY